MKRGREKRGTSTKKGRFEQLHANKENSFLPSGTCESRPPAFFKKTPRSGSACGLRPRPTSHSEMGERFFLSRFSRYRRVIFFSLALANEPRTRHDLAKLLRWGKPNLVDVAANHTLLRPPNGPPRLLDLCLFRLLQEGRGPLHELVGGHVPMDQLARRSPWPCLANSRASVTYSVAIYIPVPVLGLKKDGRVRSRRGFLLFGRDRAGYNRRSELPVTVFEREDEIRLYVDLPFCPSDKDEIFDILHWAMATPTFRPSYGRLTPGPISGAELCLHVRHEKGVLLLVKEPLLGCHFYLIRFLLPGGCPFMDEVNLTQLRETFMADAGSKITSSRPRRPLLKTLNLRGRTVYIC